MEMREATSEPHRARGPAVLRWWNERLAVLVLALASLLGFVMTARNCPGEHDRHVVASRVREWEQAIRSRRSEAMLLVQDNRAPEDNAASREARQQVLADFERLGRLDDLRITDIVVKVDGDKALASYRIRGVAHPMGASVPRGGQLQFMLRKGRWQIAGHSLVE
jgi:hypothetical protein